MKKKITVVTLVVIMVAMLFTGLTLAYFTDTDEAENVFTYGNVSIDLYETEWTGDKTVFPGMTYAKNPYIANSGDSEAYVRIGVKVNAADLKAINSKDAAYAITDATLLTNLLVDMSSDWTFDKVVEVDNGTNLIFWYNYSTDGKLVALGTTAPLFEAVKIPAELTYTQVQAASEFKLTVIAQAVQTASFNSAAEAFAATFG